MQKIHKNHSKLTKKLISLVLSLSMTAVFVPSLAFAWGIFSDVTGSEYYAEAAEYLSRNNVISGYENGSFGASRTVTRAEMAAIVCRILKEEGNVAQYKGLTRFSDVSSDNWASGYINIASIKGVIEGDGNGRFRPEDEVKYEEAVKMIVRAIGADVNISASSQNWAAEYIAVAKQNNVITTNLIGSVGTAITRGDIAVMVYNATKRN